jgi:hypothetical protein
MKRLIFFLMLSIGFTGFQNHRSDFSGKWKLDMKKSKDLPASFKSVDSYKIDITQLPDSMVLHTEMVGAGQTVNFPPTVYKFDSSEVFREDTLRGSKRWIRSAWTTTAYKLIVTSKVVQNQKGKEQRYTQTDVWQFGKRNTLLLLITQKFEKNDSTHSEQRVFHRVQ